MPEDTSNVGAGFWWKLVNLNPVILRTAIVAIFMVAGALGIVTSDGLADSLIAGWIAVMSLVQMVWTRTGVTPNAKVVVAMQDPTRSDTWVVPGAAVTEATDAAIVRAARNTPSA